MMNLPSNFGTPMMRDPRRPPRSHSRSHSESQLQMGKVDAATTSSTATTVCSTGNSSLGSAAMMHLQATLKEQSLMEAGLNLHVHGATGTSTGTSEQGKLKGVSAKGPEAAAGNQHKHTVYKPHSLPTSVTPLRASASSSSSSGTGTGPAKMTDLNGQGGGNKGIHPLSGPQAHHGHPSQAEHQTASQMQAQDQAVAPTLRPNRLDGSPQASVYPVQPQAHIHPQAPPQTTVPPGGAKPPLFQVLKTQTTDLSSHSSSLPPAAPSPSLPSGHAPDGDANTTTPTSSSVEKIRFSLLGITGEAILSASKRNLASELQLQQQQPEDTTTQESTALDFRDELDVLEASSSRQLDLSDELKRRERANLYLHGAAIGGLVLIVLIILGLLFGT